MKEAKAECHLCMITSYEQISPPRLVWKKNSSHLHLLCLVILFNSSAMEFIYAKLRNFTISKRGWVVNMHKGQSLHWETKTHKLNRSIKAGFKRQLSIKRCVFAYSLFTTAELSLRGGAMGLLWQSVGFTDAQNVGFWILRSQFATLETRRKLEPKYVPR